MFSEVANSVAWIFTSKPASLTIACTTSAIRCASEVVGVISVKLGIGHPGFLQQRLGARDVALRDRHVLRVERVVGRDPLVADDGLVVHHHLHDAVAVERQLEGLAHPRRCRARLVFARSLLPTLIVMPW